jgi:prepilin-type N-terminal cleavage/methylation domain-containing protein
MPLRPLRSPRTSAPERCAGQSGVTLVELLIASAIFLIVVLLAFDALDTTSKAQSYQTSRTNTLDDMRGVLNRMTRELRQATSVDETVSSASSIKFSTYVNGVITDIAYTASGSDLIRQVGTASPYTALDHLSSTSVFGYTPSLGQSGVQWVDISLHVSPKGVPNTTLVLESEVNLRNRTSALTG